QPILPGWLSALLSVAFVLSAVAVLFFAYLTVQHLLSSPIDEAEASNGLDGGLSPVSGGCHQSLLLRGLRPPRRHRYPPSARGKAPSALIFCSSALIAARVKPSCPGQTR